MRLVSKNGNQPASPESALRYAHFCDYVHHRVDVKIAGYAYAVIGIGILSLPVITSIVQP